MMQKGSGRGPLESIRHIGKKDDREQMSEDGGQMSQDREQMTENSY